jgi:putative tricarboxylic transport membrane protein
MYTSIKKYIPSIIIIILSSIFVSNLFIGEDQNAIGLVFPKIISISLLICGVLLALRTYAADRVQSRAKDESTSAVSQEKIYAPLLFVLVGYVLMMNVIGFFIATLLFLYACCRVFNAKVLHSIIFSVVATGIIYVLFIQILFVPFPDGIWIFKNFSNLIMY